MNLFGSDDNDDNEDSEDSEINAREREMAEIEGREPEPKVTVTETREADYTEHKATLTYTDGSTREFTFDSMNRGEHGITFKDYTGAYQKHKVRVGLVERFTSEAFLFVPYGSMQDLETTGRESKSKEYEVEVEKPKSEVGGE